MCLLLNSLYITRSSIVKDTHTHSCGGVVVVDDVKRWERRGVRGEM